MHYIVAQYKNDMASTKQSSIFRIFYAKLIIIYQMTSNKQIRKSKLEIFKIQNILTFDYVDQKIIKLLLCTKNNFI